MENVIVAAVDHHQRSAAVAAKKKTKTKKKKPIRVVYISNPMKFNTSATEFRSLVQKLTGQDSDSTNFGVGRHQTEDQPPPLDNLSGSKIDGGDNQVLSFDSANSAVSPPDLPPPPPPPPPPGLFDEPFDEYEYDDTFIPPLQHQTCETNNISGFLFSDFSHVDLIYDTR